MTKLDRILDPYRCCAMTTFLLSMAVYTTQSQAQVILDGTTGPSGELTGPDFEITDDLGARAGDNLFHSFSDFSIDTGESATFSGPDDIANVVSRVTGSNPSDINGTLRSTMPEADFYFINPNGITFGPDATLDVQGSFHVSTADELRFEGGEVFSASEPDASGFAVAEPRAFGFLDAEPGAILVDGAALPVGGGETLSLVGGDVIIDGGPADEINLVFAESGTINLFALGEVAEADLITGDVSGKVNGEIALINGALVVSSGDGGGEINIRGKSLHMENASSIFLMNTGIINGEGNINVVVDKLELAENSSILSIAESIGDGNSITIKTGVLNISDEAGILSSATGIGDGGSITVEVGHIMIDGFEGQGSITGIVSGTGLAGDAGDIIVVADEIEVLNGGDILSSTSALGDAGSVKVTADELLISGEDATLGELTGIASNTTPGSQGDAGDVIVTVSNLEILDGGAISSLGQASGNAGPVFVEADQIVLDNGAIGSQTASGSSGSSNNVLINSRILEINQGGVVTSSTSGDGNGGEIRIEVGRLTLDGGVSPNATGISSQAQPGSIGSSGDVIITADEIQILGTLTQITSSTAGLGNAGDIIIAATQLSIDGNGGSDTGIQSQGNTSDATGDAGNINISVDELVLDNSAGISTSTFGSGLAGNVMVNALEVDIATGSSITSSSVGVGQAGSISLIADNLRIDGQGLDSSTGIESTGFGEGQAGDIVIVASVVTIDDAVVITEANFSEGGQISVDAEQQLLITNAEVISDGVEPQEGASLIELNGNLITVNNSSVTSLTGEGEPITGSGVIDVDGDAVLISTDSVVDASSSVEISGLLTDFSNQLVVLESQFVDASRLLRESCESGGDLGGSTFVTSGQSPAAIPGDGLLPGFYSGTLISDQEETEAGDPVVLVVPCS